MRVCGTLVPYSGHRKKQQAKKSHFVLNPRVWEWDLFLDFRDKGSHDHMQSWSHTFLQATTWSTQTRRSKIELVRHQSPKASSTLMIRNRNYFVKKIVKIHTISWLFNLTKYFIELKIQVSLCKLLTVLQNIRSWRGLIPWILQVQ